MMNDFTVASAKEINLFMQRHCKNEKARLRIARYFKVEVEAYEVLAPGQQVYSWINGGKLIGNAVIAFRVKDMREMRLYYPVFPETIGKKLLKAWRLQVPPKWSIYAADNRWLHYGEEDRLNQELCRLLIYGRLFIGLQRQVYCPLPYSFKELYLQLHEFSDATVDISVVRMVNNVLREYLHKDSLFMNCSNLQDFIAYLHNSYTLLQFIDADFSGLRQLLKQDEIECYF